MANDPNTVELVDTMSLRELCHFCAADKTWIFELVAYGVLEPDGSSQNEWLFRGGNILRAKKARRLQRDLGLNTPGVAMVLDLLEERDALLRRIIGTEKG